MDTPEEFRDIAGFEGCYQISNHGRVKSLERVIIKRDGRRQPCKERIMKTSFCTDYPSIVLKRNGKNVSYTIHGLVLRAFVGDAPEGQEACHGDGNKYNSHLSNLRWDTPLNNHADKLRQGTQAKGERIHKAKLTATQVLAIRADPRNAADVARAYSLTHRNVRLIRLRKTWKHLP